MTIYAAGLLPAHLSLPLLPQRRAYLGITVKRRQSGIQKCGNKLIWRHLTGSEPSVDLESVL
ncbi:hypothetical protein AJ88_23880 [Mesorhizobium amorphae CCBAU 01583]|nr:hypothetical protein AJ88_23880 [Mesorhizobium amorphae CCBAU 01583]